MKDKKKQKKNVLIIGLLLIALLTYFIILPLVSAGHSVINIYCNEETYEKLKTQMNSGNTKMIRGAYSPEEDKITVYSIEGEEVTKPVREYTPREKKTFVHELCHQKQKARGFTTSEQCSFTEFLMESECHLKHNFYFLYNLKED